MLSETQAVRQIYSNIFVIVSPPRCSSTALARVFWEHPSVRYYSHEPFETVYFRDHSLDDALANLKSPLDLQPLKSSAHQLNGKGLIVKEMPYQVGRYFEWLADLATAPIVFLIRDPRLNIASRMKKKEEVGDSPIFPLVETGWQLLDAQIDLCRRNNIPFVVVDSEDFRNRPDEVLPRMFEQLGLSFSNTMLDWRPQPSVEIDNLDGQHSHLYYKVLQSKGILPDNETAPPVESFPTEGGFRQHVVECMDIYDRLRALPERVTRRPVDDSARQFRQN